MKENLDALRQALQEEKAAIYKEKITLEKQLRTLNGIRQTEARKRLNTMLPDLDSGTITALHQEVPEFAIPMVAVTPGFFGGVIRFFTGGQSEMIDPEISIDALRMQLGSYLDNADKANRPDFWNKQVGDIDESIQDLQTNLIRANAEQLVEISNRLEAIEKLQATDFERMKPEMQAKIDEAVKSQVKQLHSGKRFTRVRPISKTPPVYPSSSQTSSDSGPGLLEMWLWYEILSSHSEYAQEAQRIEPGGGEFGGAGASGDFSVDSAQASPVEADQGGDALAGAGAFVASAALSDTTGIDQHYDHGAGNFS
jgi:hypothetical protein